MNKLLYFIYELCDKRQQSKMNCYRYFEAKYSESTVTNIKEIAFTLTYSQPINVHDAVHVLCQC